MKDCCYDPANLKTYATTKKTPARHPGLLVVTYQAYMKCRKCDSKLKSEITKNIHSRDTTSRKQKKT